jgi:hypothetical protein
MADVIPLRKAPDPNARNLSDERAEAFVSTIKQLFSELALSDQEQVVARLTEILRPIPAPRAGDVLGALIYLLPKRQEWTVQELMDLLLEQGVEHKPKEVYNALGYLTRKHKIQRTGHGRYTIGGIPVVTSDELGGAPSKDEEHDANS